MVSHTGVSIIFDHMQAKPELRNCNGDPSQSYWGVNHLSLCAGLRNDFKKFSNPGGVPVHRPTYIIVTL